MKISWRAMKTVKIPLLASYFKVSQEAFNRPYKLVNPANSHLRNASVMNMRKKVEFAGNQMPGTRCQGSNLKSQTPSARCQVPNI